jgi:hypothetical protein
MSHAEITLKEVYDILVDVRNDVTSIKSELKNTSEDVKDHETRLRALEKWIWAAAGTGVVGGAGLAQVLQQLLG